MLVDAKPGSGIEVIWGKSICIAGEEVFAGDTPEEAVSLAAAAHPKDEGSFVHYIPREKMTRVYADQR